MGASRRTLGRRAASHRDPSERPSRQESGRRHVHRRTRGRWPGRVGGCQSQPGGLRTRKGKRGESSSGLRSAGRTRQCPLQREQRRRWDARAVPDERRRSTARWSLEGPADEGKASGLVERGACWPCCCCCEPCACGSTSIGSIVSGSAEERRTSDCGRGRVPSRKVRRVASSRRVLLLCTAGYCKLVAQ